MRSGHLVYNATGQGDKLNNLRGEYFEIPSKLRRKWICKAVQRELILYFTGQKLLQREHLPRRPIKILWFYDWNTLGDSIMDLSQRFLFPEYITLDVCMPKGPAEIFSGDPRFDQIFTRTSDCPNDYDFILLHDISSTSIRLKLTRFFFKPWASMINHQQGEQYSRTNFAALRIGQLFGQRFEPLRPYIPISMDIQAERNRIAVALGGIDGRRRYSHWPEVLEVIVEKLGPERAPRFALLGAGKSAMDDLAKFPPKFLQNYADVELDQPSLLALKIAVARCGFFIGADSGIMHLAEGLDKPGVALFGCIRPEWRLLPESRLRAMADQKTVININPHDIAEAFVEVYESEWRV